MNVSLLILIAFSSVHAQTTCPKVIKKSGNDCSNIVTEFDYSCMGESHKQTVKANCWNNKAVSVSNFESRQYIATFINSSDGAWGNTTEWKLASVRTKELESKKAVVVNQNVPVIQREVSEVKKQNNEFIFYGALDTYYSYNFGEPVVTASTVATNTSLPAAQNSYRAFDIYHDKMSLALAYFGLKKESGPVTAKLELGFGNNTDILSSADESTKNILQGVITYKPESLNSLTLNFGKMFTHLGWETTYAQDNWNYSRSLLFNYAIPYWHEGMSATYQILDGFTSSFYLYNNAVGVYQNNRSKTYGAQIGISKIKDLNLIYNLLFGKEDPNPSSNDSIKQQTHELVATYTLNNNFSLAFDVVYGVSDPINSGTVNRPESEWLATSYALKYELGNFYLSPRYERFKDEKGLRFNLSTATEITMESATITFGYSLHEQLKFKTEYRRDWSDRYVFIDENLSDKYQNTLTLGLIATF